MKKTASTTPKDALEYLRKKGYKLSWDHQEVWREQHVHSFTCAKVLAMDVLVTLRQGIDEALEQGLPFANYKQQMTELLAAEISNKPRMATSLKRLLVPQRLQLIYGTNVRVARSVGQWQRIERSKESLPYLLYELGPSREHRNDHVVWDGTILPVDDPFWQTHMPPNGWGCKCRVRQLTQAQVNKRGGLSSRPKVSKTLWQHPQTGKKVQVPQGLDPGWDYNPGQHYLQHLGEVVKDKKMIYKHLHDKMLRRALMKQATILVELLAKSQQPESADFDKANY